MRRRSKEPRRISVVEGSAAASLARVLMIVSCFIYKNETSNHRSSQPLPEHFFHLCCWASGKDGGLHRNRSFIDAASPYCAVIQHQSRDRLPLTSPSRTSELRRSCYVMPTGCVILLL